MDGVRRLDDNCILIFHFVVYPQVIDLLVRCAQLILVVIFKTFLSFLNFR